MSQDNLPLTPTEKEILNHQLKLLFGLWFGTLAIVLTIFLFFK
jgi:hypothetical protein